MGKAIHTEVFDPDNPDARHELIISYTFEPGCKPTGPSWSSPGDPGYPPEVEIVSAKNSLNNLPVFLTEAEKTRITNWLAENHREPERDDD